MTDEKLYLEMINHLEEGVYAVDRNRRITFWNRAAEIITGYKREEVLGKSCGENLLSHMNEDGAALCGLKCPLRAAMRERGQQNSELFLKHKDGHRTPVTAKAYPIAEGDEIIGAMEIFSVHSPVVYDTLLIEQLSNLAMIDPLTGLSNRRKLECFLEFRLEETKCQKAKICVIFMDIDNFGNFNNTYGHDLGDEVLKRISETVMNNIRKSDLFSRWGGEEFVGVFEIQEDFQAPLIAEKMRGLIERAEVRHGERTLFVTASLGVTVACGSDTMDSVIKRADGLMYQSKQKGKNCVTADV